MIRHKRISGKYPNINQTTTSSISIYLVNFTQNSSIILQHQYVLMEKINTRYKQIDQMFRMGNNLMKLKWNLIMENVFPHNYTLDGSIHCAHKCGDTIQQLCLKHFQIYCCKQLKNSIAQINILISALLQLFQITKYPDKTGEETRFRELLIQLFRKTNTFHWNPGIKANAELYLLISFYMDTCGYFGENQPARNRWTGKSALLSFILNHLK